MMHLRYGIRSLMKRPTFTIISVLTLALCIGATVAIFSVADSVLLSPLPYKDPERIVAVRQHLPKMDSYSGGVSAIDIAEYSSRIKTLNEIASYRIFNANMTGVGDATQHYPARVSHNLFSLLGLTPVLGRYISPQEDKVGNDDVVVISESLWRNRFSSNKNALGRKLKLNERSYTIIGVMPSQVRLPAPGGLNSDAIDLFVPLALTDQERLTNNRDPMFNLIGHLKPGITIEQAKADLALVASQIEKSFPDVFKDNFRITATVEGLLQELTGKTRQVVWLLFAAVGLVLLIAVVNIANLQLVRSLERQKDIAIKGALGVGGGESCKGNYN